MSISNYQFTLNLQKTQSQIAVPVTRGDTARAWLISLADGSTPYTLADGCLAKLEIKRPSGTHLEEFCPIENNRTVRYSFSQNANTAAVEGVHDCALVLYDKNGDIIGSPRFMMIVSDRVVSTDDIHLSDEDVTAVDAMIAEEVKRQNAEAARISTETARQSIEAARVSAETERATAEAVRKTSETERAGAEAERARAENERASAERDRQQRFDEQIDNMLPNVTAEDEGNVMIVSGGAWTSKKIEGIEDIRLSVEMDADNVVTISLVNSRGEVLASGSVDLPLGSAIVGGREEGGKLIFVLQSGDTIEVEVGNIINGLVSQETFDNHKHTKSEITDFPTAMAPTSHKHAKSEITDFPASMTPSAHNQSASTITGGSFNGAVWANPGGQDPFNFYLRNSMLNAGEVTPEYNGEICWQYE